MMLNLKDEQKKEKGQLNYLRQHNSMSLSRLLDLCKNIIILVRHSVKRIDKSTRLLTTENKTINVWA